MTYRSVSNVMPPKISGICPLSPQAPASLKKHSSEPGSNSTTHDTYRYVKVVKLAHTDGKVPLNWLSRSVLQHMCEHLLSIQSKFLSALQTAQ